MTYENVPFAEIPATLSAEEAAEFTGYTPGTFRTLMIRLNNTPQDLRSPRQPGERGARRYDKDKLQEWINSGKPLPDSSPRSATPAANARQITGTAHRQNGKWLATMPEINQGTQADNLRNLRRNAQALAADTLGTPRDQVAVSLDVKIPDDTAAQWAQVREQEDRARAMIAEAAQKRRNIIAGLRAQGCINDDIADMLGISTQRVQQLAKEADQ